MGCDIHFYVERINSKNTWSSTTRKWYIGRSYSLFGILAGVRSKFIEPPIQPRGLPSNPSPRIKQQFKLWAGDAHTPSYIYLNELLEIKEKKITLPCWLDIKNYKLYKTNNTIEDQDVLYEPYKGNIISEEEMMRRINLLSFAEETNYFVNIEAEFSLGIINPDFWNGIVEDMRQLHKDTSKVRAVFWFDN